ncbi:MAG: carbon starvation protein A [Spirochaetes bacterium]|nr:MAG: carbon starvation protein A [Spirochaetota bacterium]
MVAIAVIISIAALALGYFTYGRFITKSFNLDDSKQTPSCAINDGVDYVPAKASLLLGQHFSAIAAAGPIVGPILAGIWFGWLPAFLWIIIGAIFIGGIHDFGSLIASVRHNASSVAELVKRYMTPLSYVLFLIFIWLTLIYVIIAFTDITAQTFKAVAADTAFGPGVAFSSFLYLLLGVAMGILLYKLKMNLTLLTAIFMPLVIAVIWLGTMLPVPVIDFLSGISVKQWEVVLLVYCFVASMIPMWLLLQPRGYLGGWFLYLTIAIALVGALFGGYEIKYPALNIEGLSSLANGKWLFPILFITVACGACSGFHGIVSSGTTSKQICKESDTRVIGYGTMILEGVVAILALATVMMLSKNDEILKTDPNLIYANGLAQYMGMIGIDYNMALAFALLAFSTFVYDTLDVCTRLARYILQELLGWQSLAGGAAATFITLLIPLAFLLLTEEKGYLVAWPIFGTSNQLLASLTLLAVGVWMIHEGRKAVYVLVPMGFMLAVTVTSLVTQIVPFLNAMPSLLSGTAVKRDIIIVGIASIVIFVLCILIIIEAFRILVLKKGRPAPASA